MPKIKVLIVDDSALVRQVLSKILGQDEAIEVVGVAPDPFVARERIKALDPDVLTLDVEMPRMDGLTFLRNLMRLHPMPVVMVSSLTEKGAEITLEALEIGAVDFVSKPKVDLAHTLEDYADELIGKVKAASRVRVQPRKTVAKSRRPSIPTTAAGTTPPQAVEEKLDADAVIKARRRPIRFQTTEQIFAIGASTGGTEAIKEVLIKLPADTPGTVITQHIPPVFSTSFARRLDEICAMNVYEASDGQQVMRGCAYIAPGDKHLLLERDGARYVCRLHDGPPVNRHKPSVDVLFRSVSQTAGSNATGVILTGMGDDGAQGLLEMRNSGATTIAQDEKTSVVWGMPGASVRLDAACEVLSLEKIGERLLQLIR